MQRLLWRAGLVLGLCGLLFAAEWDHSTELPAPLPKVGSRDPNTLDETILAQSFDNVPGSLPAGWTEVDLDSGFSDPSQPFYGGRTIWQGLSLTGWPTHTGGGVCVNAYNYNPYGAPNNDWLILPHVPALIAPISLSFWTSAQDVSYSERYEVRVSTTTADPASFTTLIEDNVVTRPWSQHTHSLSAWAGAPFWVAIHYISVNRFALKVDDVLLTGTRPGGAIRGMVVNAGNAEPLAGVAVSVLTAGLNATTGADGTYIVGMVPFGFHNVRFTKSGFDTVVVENVAVSQGDTVPVDAALHAAVAVTELPALPSNLTFSGNYPNPFNSQTQFRFDLKHTTSLRLSLYNTLGQEIALIAAGQFSPGAHLVSLDARALPSGVYLARLDAETAASQIRKVVLLR